MLYEATPASPAHLLIAADPLPSTLNDSAPPPLDAEPARPVIRHDGWTLVRQRRFCEKLAECGVVAIAADEVGLSRQSAYDFRNRSEGRAFAALWDEARAIACRAVIDDVASTALNGIIIETREKGLVVSRTCRQSPRHLLGTIERLRSSAILGNSRTMAAARNFETCLDMLGDGLVFSDAAHSAVSIPPLPLRSDDDRDNPNPSHGYRRWTPAHQRQFCAALARCGKVDLACRSVGRGRTGAYALRNRAEGQGFALAWDAALIIFSNQLIDQAIEIARDGVVSAHDRKGKPTRYRRIHAPHLALEIVERLALLKAREDSLYGDGYRCIGIAPDFGAALDQLESGEALRAVLAQSDAGPKAIDKNQVFAVRQCQVRSVEEALC